MGLRAALIGKRRGFLTIWRARKRGNVIRVSPLTELEESSRGRIIGPTMPLPWFQTFAVIYVPLSIAALGTSRPSVLLLVRARRVDWVSLLALSRHAARDLVLPADDTDRDGARFCNHLSRELVADQPANQREDVSGGPGGYGCVAAAATSQSAQGCSGSGGVNTGDVHPPPRATISASDA